MALGFDETPGGLVVYMLFLFGKSAGKRRLCWNHPTNCTRVKGKHFRGQWFKALLTYMEFPSSFDARVWHVSG